MSSVHLLNDVDKLENRLRTLEQRFAWGVGAAAAIGLIALLSGGFSTYMLNNAEDLGGQVAAIERSVGGIDGVVNQAIGRIEGTQAAAQSALATALDRASGEIDAREAAAIAAIDRKATEAIRDARDAEWREAMSRLAKIEQSMTAATVAFDARSGCPDGWSEFDQAPFLLGLSSNPLQTAVDQAISRLGLIWCKQG